MKSVVLESLIPVNTKMGGPITTLFMPMSAEGFVLSDGEDYFLVDGGGGRRYPAVYGSDEDSVGEAAPCISDSRTHRSYSWYGMGGPLCDGADSLWKL